MTPLRIAFGSVLGRDHARLGRNNQDGVAVARHGDVLVAAVTDGCSAGARSEVGAQLGAAYLAERGLGALRSAGGISERFAPELTDGLRRYLRRVARGLRRQDESLAAIVHDYLLFGFLCLAIDRRQMVLFGIGDGVFSCDGAISVLHAGPDNAPPYLGYALVESSALVGAAPVCAPTLHLSLPTASVRSMLIGTDGLRDLILRTDEPLRNGERQGGLEAFERDARFVENPSLVQKRLLVIGERNRRLRDDTTLIVLRREVA